VCARELRPNDRVVLHDHRAFAGWPGGYGAAEGYLMGLLVGDGCLHKDYGAVLYAWDEEQLAVVNGDAPPVSGSAGIISAAEAAIAKIGHRGDYRTFGAPDSAGRRTKRSLALARLAASLGVVSKKCVTRDIESCSSDFAIAFLRGLFDADGSVQGTQEKGASVRLTQVSLDDLRAVQRMLLRLGIFSTIYRNRRPAGHRPLPDGKGGYKLYPTQAYHDLVVANENLVRYAELIGFADTDKQRRLERIVGAYKRTPSRE
jgi:ribonucleoside-diphosphate reductase alpha chain